MALTPAMALPASRCAILSACARGIVRNRACFMTHLSSFAPTSSPAAPGTSGAPRSAPLFLGVGPGTSYSRRLALSGGLFGSPLPLSRPLSQQASLEKGGREGPSSPGGNAAGAVSGSGTSSSSPGKRVGYTERVKVVIKEYGTVAVVFHTVISLCSLGSCYLVIDSGVDVQWVLDYFNMGSTSLGKGASTFAIAYVLHKLFLPLRATITVVSVPLIVRAFRARGWMKGVSKPTS